MVLGFVAHLWYLRHDCPIDLSGDEAQYWDWSRALDWSYYSKGPLVAYIIRASTELTGSSEMWAVRLPALIFAVATSVLTYWLTRRLSKSDRLALGVVVLTHLVPMFVAGSLLMTIDPPYFFCWGLASAFLALATLEEKRWAWIGVGLALGVGTLAKYGMLIWPVGMLCFLLIDRDSRKWLRTPWPWLAVGIGLLFLTPPIVWNVKHDWVTIKHVAKQTGASGEPKLLNGNFWEFVGSQAGVLGPAMLVILAGAIGFAWRRQRALREEPSQEGSHRNDRAVVLLLWMGLPLFVMCVIGSVRSKMQVNWPAAAYFSWMILAGYFLATRMNEGRLWRRWRGWVWGAVVFGVLMMPVAHNFECLYPVLTWINSVKKKHPIEPRQIDLTVAKMKGWKELGARLTKEMNGLHDPFILCEEYGQTAETAFYTGGQPKTYCVGAYITKLSDRKRRTQYDVWPDRNLAQPSLRGRDALYVGYMNDDVLNGFESVEELPEEPIYRGGYKVRRFKIYRCKGFKGLELKPPAGGF
jgi:undecaprenyl-diphosphatase